MFSSRCLRVFLFAGLLSLPACGSINELLDHQNPKDPDEPQATSQKYTVPIPVTEDGKLKFKKLEHRVLTLYGSFLVAQGGYSLATGGNVERKPDVKNFLDAGITLSNLACRDWFAYHDNLATRTNYSKGLLNILGALTVSSLGFADVSSTAMGAVALLFGGIDAGYANFKANFMLTETLGKLETKLTGVRRQSATNLFTNAANNKYSLSQARAELMDYHDSCSHRRVVQYIKDSVDLAEFSFTEADLDFDTRVKEHSLPLAMHETLRGKRGSFPVPETTLMKLYFAVYGDKQSPTIKRHRASPVIAQILRELGVLENPGVGQDLPRFTLFHEQLVEYAHVMGFPAKLDQLAVQEAEIIAAAARRTEATALMTKIEGTLDLVTQIVQAANLPDQAQLDTLKKVGNAAGKMLTEVKSVVALSADDVNKTSAETNIRNAEQGLVKVSGATGFGATASATKADADAAFRHIKQAIVTSTNVVKQMIVTDGVVATLKKADAAAAEMKQHADTPLSAPAGALAAAPAAAAAATAPTRITASQQIIDNARQILNAAMAAKQSALVTLGQTRLPTTFRIAPGR